MSNRTLVGFYLRATPLAMWFYLIPSLVFLIPWINWLGPGSSNSLDIAFMSGPGNVFGLIAGITFLYSASSAAGWATLSAPLPMAEFLLTRPLGRVRLCAVTLAIFLAVVLGPPLLVIGITAFKPDMRFSRYSHPSSAEVARQSIYEKGFPSTYIEKGEHWPILVAPRGLLYVKVWQFATLALVAAGLQLLLFRRRRGQWFDRFVAQGLILLFVVPPLLFVFRRAFITEIMETGFLFFIQHLWFCLIGVLAILVSVQVWCLRRARDIEVL